MQEARENHDAAAIARWDDEGGASMSARSNTGVRRSKDVHSKRMVEATTDLKADRAAAKNEKILECLGAAVIIHSLLLRSPFTDGVRDRHLLEHGGTD
jgi:hypothetical protein